MLLDSAESVLSVFGFQRSLFGFEKKFTRWWEAGAKVLRFKERNAITHILHLRYPGLLRQGYHILSATDNRCLNLRMIPNSQQSPHLIAYYIWLL
jgi:hypothetical protein